MTHPDASDGNHCDSDHFDAAASTWDEDPAKIERARRTAQLLRERLPLSGTERVLDIGGGTGQLSLFLADAVGAVTISDASAGMVETAIGNIRAAGLGDRFTALQLDLTAEPAPGAPFDGAWSQLALHHVPDVDRLLRTVHNSLKSGGWFAVIDLDTDAAGAFHAKHPDFHGHHGFDREEFAERLVLAGFTDVTVTDGGLLEKEGLAEGTRTFPMFLAIGYAG